jgi:hypothetical protein
MPRWGMLLCVLALPATAAADWHEAGSEHFVVYADAAEERVRKLAEDLERFDQALRVLRQLPDEPVGKANRVNVYVLDTVADVRELTGVAGSYRSRASGSVAFVPRRVGAGAAVVNRRVILFHEYAHHDVQQLLDRGVSRVAGRGLGGISRDRDDLGRRLGRLWRRAGLSR